MNTTRLGYACINTGLDTCNRTCRLATALKQGEGYPPGSPEYSAAIYSFLTEYGINNMKAMFKIIAWSKNNGIYFYRMSSDMFPHISNSLVQEHLSPEDWSNYTNLLFAADIIQEIGSSCQKYQIRLTMHPGHYNQLGAEKDTVLANTFTDLTWHANLLEILSMGADNYNNYLLGKGIEVKENIFINGTLCLHGGGQYGDKLKTLERWKENFRKLPQYIQDRIALENDEKSYSAEDLLPVCQELGIPMIFDFHHYDCWAHYHQDNPEQKPISELLPQILATWTRAIPKFHLSDQAEDKKVGAHHDYVESIPEELLELMQTGYRFDIMIEAKQKERATSLS